MKVHHLLRKSLSEGNMKISWFVTVHYTNNSVLCMRFIVIYAI